ncbi:MAG TPA: circularly permuted type 2 ATP-grasp protein [Solirubrobacteraceae bacterium]|nr:circularly permuted type 2 ATP-grasp protein [Solirubrobacteraceae bacterium]
MILTDGPANVAHTEHERAAARIGVPLVTLDQLIADGDRLWARLSGGEVRPVDVVYRRCDEDRVRDDSGEVTPVARALLPAWLAGKLGLVNAFGNGLADDKLILGQVEDFIRFYLGEEPLVPSVPTYDLSDPAERHQTLDDLRGHVVKPRHGHGGNGVVIGAAASPEELDRLARDIARDPQQYVSQPIVSLSCHPAVIDGRLEPRHVDLRAFAFCAQDFMVMPGGLSRVALEEGKLVVNSSQAGGGKDTWVVD